MRLLLLYTKIRNQTTTDERDWLQFPDYYTPKLEIKPQQSRRIECNARHYYTPKLEIKPQQL